MPVITPVTHIAKKNDRHQNYEGAQHGNYLNCDAENANKNSKDTISTASHYYSILNHYTVSCAHIASMRASL